MSVYDTAPNDRAKRLFEYNSYYVITAKVLAFWDLFRGSGVVW